MIIDGIVSIDRGRQVTRLDIEVMREPKRAPHESSTWLGEDKDHYIVPPESPIQP